MQPNKNVSSDFQLHGIRTLLHEVFQDKLCDPLFLAWAVALSCLLWSSSARRTPEEAPLLLTDGCWKSERSYLVGNDWMNVDCVPQPITALSSAGRRAPWEAPAASAPAAAPSVCGAATWSSASTPTPTSPPSPSDSAWSGTPWTHVHVRLCSLYSSLSKTKGIQRLQECVDWN